MSDRQKKMAATAALQYIETGMTLGLGTGSTVYYLLEGLGERVRQGLDVCGVPTSEQTRQQASMFGIRLLDFDAPIRIDMAIDGTDECDENLHLIKGGGGALLREKIIAAASAQMLVIADASKKVTQLGTFPLPVEIDRFCWPLSVQAMQQACVQAGVTNMSVQPRMDTTKTQMFLSDGGHYIVDIACGNIPDSVLLDQLLRAIPGVVETGIFVGLADMAIFGTEKGVERLGTLRKR